MCFTAHLSRGNIHFIAYVQVVDHGQFQDARTLLSTAALVYERSSDQERLSKVTRITSLVGLVEETSSALQECRYADAETLVEECLQECSALASLQPLSLRSLDCNLLQTTGSSSEGGGEGEGGGGGGGGAKRIVLCRALAAGNADRVTALALLEKGEYEAANIAAASASSRFMWWASQGGENGDDRSSTGHSDPDYRHAVVRKAEELTATVAAAAGKARAEGQMMEARDLKAMGDFAGAMTALSVAARLFFGAGLAARAAAARAEADQTQAEALILLAEELHGEGKFEDIEENLQKAEALLRAAVDTADGATLATSAPPTESSTVGGANNKGGGADGSEDVVGSGTGPQMIIDDLYKFRSRVAGDIVVRGVEPALDGRDYDLALRLMLEANGHYADAGAGRWAASAVGGGGNYNSSNAGAALVSPKDVVVKRAAQDGERLRADAALAIQKEKKPSKSRELLSMAERCMEWAGVDPVAAGAAAVTKDIHIYESRAAGDEVCKGVISPLQRRESGPAIGMLERALGKYRQVWVRGAWVVTGGRFVETPECSFSPYGRKCREGAGVKTL